MLGHLQPLEVVVLRLENRPEAWPSFAGQVPELAPFEEPEGTGCSDLDDTPNYKVLGSQTHYSGSNGTAKLAGAHHIVDTSLSFLRAPDLTPPSAQLPRSHSGGNASEGCADVRDACDGMAVAGHGPPPPPTVSEPCAAPSECDRSAAPSVAGVVTSSHPPADKHHGVAPWKEIVALVCQCWELELEKRPSAATLQARARAIDGGVYCV